MIVKHVTGVSNAISILKTQQYLPNLTIGTKADVWINGDFCLNLLPPEDMRIYSGMERDATIYFEWFGEVKELIDMRPIQYSRDVLYIDSRGCEIPWRYFIKPFNTPELLRIVDVKFNEKALEEFIKRTEISIFEKIKLFFKKGSYQNNLYELKRQNFDKNLMDKLKEKPTISIIDPMLEKRLD